MSSSDSTKVVWGFAIGLGLFVQGIRWFLKKRMIELIPTSKVRSLSMGLVEVYGDVVPAEGSILKAQLSGKDCVYFRYTIEKINKDKERSVVLKSLTEKSVHFYLRDDTGSVLVDATGAEVDIPFDSQKETVDPGLFGERLRHTEYIIEPNDKLYILGTAGDNPFVEEGTAVEGVKDVMIQRGANEKFYYISDQPEDKLLKNLYIKSIGGMLGGGLISSFCLYALLAEGVESPLKILFVTLFTLGFLALSNQTRVRELLKKWQNRGQSEELKSEKPYKDQGDI